ncbi:hypothetical protein C3477_24690 [Mycobacterium kansasii]|nr:hypothetical protein C3B43_00330 [Mycobacterium kansasii]POX97979.1 hypothetical protein C3477_24690 [Mycobacterium kansasii]POY24446.1 hypothetical protein C3476_04290 [Mycobacterium kansasii]
MTDVSRLFSRLVFQAIEAPETVDRNALLIAADALLSLFCADDTPGITLARRMAFRACDWAVFGGPDDHAKLRRSAKLFGMASAIQ